MKGVPIGTRSLLFGAHQFALHPLFVAWAWWQLYGAPRDYRLWCAFVLHDWGYWSKPNMDGPEGEEHPVWAADIMGRRFGPEWHDFCLFHSRFFCRKYKQHYSRLCVADKLAIALTPWWLYLPMVWATGEVEEYRQLAVKRSTRRTLQIAGATSAYRWYRELQTYMREWAYEHRDGRLDVWTSDEVRMARTDEGVYQ